MGMELRCLHLFLFRCWKGQVGAVGQSLGDVGTGGDPVVHLGLTVQGGSTSGVVAEFSRVFLLVPLIQTPGCEVFDINSVCV